MSRPMAHLLSKLLSYFPADGLLPGGYKIGIWPFWLHMRAALSDVSVVQHKNLVDVFRTIISGINRRCKHL